MVWGDPLLNVLLVTEDMQLGSVVQETLITSLPYLTVDVEREKWVEATTLARATCVVLDSDLPQSSGVEALRRYRAIGFPAAAIMLLDRPSPGVAMRAAALGAPLTVLKSEIPTRLPAAVVAAARTYMLPGLWHQLYEQVRRTQSLIALGQQAVRATHRLNNLMTVIVSEAGMIQLDESLAPEVRRNAQAIVESSRVVKQILTELGNPSGVSGVDSGVDVPGQ
jgi:DNA-binding NarL/FixJ family response regulator